LLAPNHALGRQILVEISSLWITTTILTRLSNSEQRGCATGFFFADSGNLYLVTNKHVIYGNNFIQGQPMIDSVELNLHINRANLTENEEVTINLFDEDQQKWLEHAHPAVDVVLIPVTLDRNRFVIATLDNTFLEQENVIIDDFQKIFVMGYPFGWYDRFNNLPITRIGHLSSPFKSRFQGMPMMIGDVTTHQGMSGGPVFMQLDDYTVKNEDGSRTKMLGRRKLLLAGINSGQFELPEGRSNLISIWFSELIREILHPQA
jgi:hypothetical protein